MLTPGALRNIKKANYLIFRAAIIPPALRTVEAAASQIIHE